MPENCSPHKSEDAYVCKICGAVFNGPYTMRKPGALTFQAWTGIHNQPHCIHLQDHLEVEVELECDECKVAYVMET